MPTNVPAPTFGPNGFVSPTEAEILAGVQADFQTAFGGVLNPALNTPQGQLATSEAAIIGDCNNQFVSLANGVDPAYASGRMQDAIARIYFLERKPAQATTVTATCTGLFGTAIPIGARAVDQAGNIYLCMTAGTIPVSGHIDLSFSCATTGAIPCPIGYLSAIYQAIAGWDSVLNAAAGAVGYDVESRADFEYRREQSVAINSQGALDAVLGAVFDVSGVLDAYATENDTSVTSGAAFTATMAGTVMTVTAISDGTIAPGQTVIGVGEGVAVEQGVIIVSLGTGTGGTGTYNINVPQTISEALLMTSAIGGVRLVPHSLYVAAYGGSNDAIARAIWTKKSPGCDYNGNTTVTVQDTSYPVPCPQYAVTFEIPDPVAIEFDVSMRNGPDVPINAMALVQNAIISAFTGADGGERARIGSGIFASRYYAAVNALGPWALVYTIEVGVGGEFQVAMTVQINQIPTLSASDINVTFG